MNKDTVTLEQPLKPNWGGQKSCQSRVVGLDFVRSVAILFVIAGHFISINTPFRQTVFEGVSMFLQGAAMPLFATGVPLFIMLTGYLNANKTVSRRYYRGCIRVLVSYLLFSVLTILFRRYWLHEELSWVQWGLKIFDFSAIPYGWYIEMWIGLFLLAPFLNLLYKAIPTKRQKHILLLTIYLLTAVPDLFNRYGLHLVPGFWQMVYPLMFFFAGSYIREYRPQVAAWKLWAVIVVLCLINPVFNAVFVSGHTMISPSGGFAGVVGSVIAVAFFLLCYRVDFSSVWVRTVLMKVSMLSLDMYLCCYMVDRLVYPWFLGRYFVDQSQFGAWFFVVVPVVFIGSFLIAWVKETISRLPSTIIKL